MKKVRNIFGTVPKSNRKIGDRSKIDTPNMVSGFTRTGQAHQIWNTWGTKHDIYIYLFKIWECLFRNSNLSYMRNIGVDIGWLKNSLKNQSIVLRFASFPVVDWFCLFIDLWVLTFPLEDCSVFGNFVITLICRSMLWCISSLCISMDNYLEDCKYMVFYFRYIFIVHDNT